MADRHPFIFPRLFDARGNRVLEVSVLVENIPGMIAKVAKRLAEEGVNILSGVHHECSEAESGEKGWWCFFVECYDLVAAERLKNLIGELEGVKEVLVSEANIGRFAIDRHHSLHYIGVDRVVIFMVGWLTSVLRKIYDVWGDDGRRMVYFEGVYGGRRSYRTISSAFGLKGRELAETALDLWVLLGWVERVRLVKLDPEAGEVIIRVWGSFEASRPSDRPTCHLLLGAATGFFSEMMAKPLFGMEVKCQARGDEYCEFVMREEHFMIPR